VRDLNLPAKADTPGLLLVSFDVHAGELFGIAGIDGNGQKELAEALAGQLKGVHGTVRLAGTALERMGVGRRRKHGLRYLTDDRLGEGTDCPVPRLDELLPEGDRDPATVALRGRAARRDRPAGPRADAAI
jgi:ABC-type uncharacterized transport system ATPase subunit